MINFNNLPQTITAAVGAILISAVFVSASVGPVHADQLRGEQASVQTSAQANA